MLWKRAFSCVSSGSSSPRSCGWSISPRPAVKWTRSAPWGLCLLSRKQMESLQQHMFLLQMLQRLAAVDHQLVLRVTQDCLTSTVQTDQVAALVSWVFGTYFLNLNHNLYRCSFQILSCEDLQRGRCWLKMITLSIMLYSWKQNDSTPILC